MKKKRYKK